MCVRSDVCAFLRTCGWVSVCACIYTCMYAYVRARVFVCVPVCACVLSVCLLDGVLYLCSTCTDRVYASIIILAHALPTLGHCLHRRND